MPVSGPKAVFREGCGDDVEDAAEVGEDDDFAVVGGAFGDDLDQPGEFRGLAGIGCHVGGPAHGHEQENPQPA